MRSVVDGDAIDHSGANQQHGLALLKGGLPLCTRLMNEMHAKLMTHGRGASKAPGELRRTQNWIGGASPSRAAFVPPPPQRLGDWLSDLEKFLNDQPVRHSALQVHQALFARPVSTIPAIGTVTGQSPHTVGKMRDAMIELGLVREVTGMRRNRI